MKLQAPVIITPRLMPGVRVADSFVSIECDNYTRDGRQAYRYHIDTPTFEYSGGDLKSGVGNGTLQSGLASLLAFLGAAAEAYSYTMRTGRESDNSDLFPAHVTEWAYQHSDELSMIGCELDETPGLISDEHNATQPAAQPATATEGSQL